MEIKSVLVLDEVGRSCLEILNMHGFEVTVKLSMNEEELISEIPGYDVIVVRSATKITNDVLSAGKRLKVVASAGIYCDNIDLFAAMNQKLVVINAPRSCVVSMSEYTCGLLLALARQLLMPSNQLVDPHAVPHIGEELIGKTLALIGLSDVAEHVANLMKAFGMTIIGWDPAATEDTFENIGITMMDLNLIWPRADYIVFYTAPFNNECFTANLNAEMLRTCKWGVKIVTVGHIGTIQMGDWIKFVHEGLISGQVAGTAFDLYVENIQQMISKYDVLTYPGVLSTLHLGVNTEEAIEGGGQEVAEQIVNLAEPNTYETKLNVVLPLDN